MLIFYLGKAEPIIEFPHYQFNMVYEPHWLESDFGRDIIKGVDNSDVISGGLKNGGGVIGSPVLGSIPPSKLSTGTRSALLARFWDGCNGFYLPGDKMGDNVYPYIVRAANEVTDRDIMVRVGRLLRVPWDGTDEILMMPRKEKVIGYAECLHYLALHTNMFWRGEGYGT
jgi:hypothetical protein